MRNFITLTLLALLSLTFTSCSSDDDDATDQTTDYYFRAKIDGQDFEADTKSLMALDMGIQINITANKEYSSTQNVFFLVINPFDGVATYQTSDDDIILHALSFVGENDNWTTANPGGSGVIEITKYDVNEKVIEGTFSFVGKSDDTGTMIHVTDGEFKMELSNQ